MQHLSSRLARLAVEGNLCHSFQAFHSSYSDTGLMGIYFVADKNCIEDMMHWSQNAWSVMLVAPVFFFFFYRTVQPVHIFFSFAPERMNVCTTVTESDVARGKNALKASLVGQLNGMRAVI